MGWFLKRKPVDAGLLGVYTGPEGLALARIQRAGQATTLLECQLLRAGQAEQSAALKRYVDEHDLKGASVNLVLPPSHYQVGLLDAPEVPAEELRDAMRWRIKGMIAEPLEEVVVDACLLPEDAYRGRARRAYCFVLNKTRMQACAALITQAGLQLQSIDVTEMALRNLGLLAGAAELNLGLLRLGLNDGLICVQNGAELYMARRIERDLPGAEGDFGPVSLEIQRSLDYFESQLGKGYISRLLLLPSKRDSEETLQALGAGLAVNLQSLTLQSLFAEQPAAEVEYADQMHCLLAVGAALRQESA